MSKPVFAFKSIQTVIGEALLASFEIPGGVTTPEEFAAAVAENSKSFVPPEGHGLVLDGRGPMWGYAMMAHEGHPSSWLATRDPRLGMIVVASHSPDRKVGEVAPFPAE